MSLSVQIFPDPVVGCARIRCESENQITQVLRETFEGWTPVRLIKDVLPTNTLICEDFECPFGYDVRYKVVADNEEPAYAMVRVNCTDTILSLPHMPAIQARIPYFVEYNAQRRMPGSTDAIIGRADPLITILPLQKRQGSLSYTFNSYDDMRIVGGMYSHGYPLLLRQPCHKGLDLYHVAESVSYNTDKTGPVIMWTINVNYVECNIPHGDLVEVTGWDYQALADKWPDYATMQSSYADYGMVMMGLTL